ncbi:hypothetical protein [Nonomuraea sp. NPDC059022]|uniref:hypothetical protein n=1 Tax=Nonomuraea sp. NPDC059022 TaxID=3346705 RepID=UPI00368077F4
MLAPAPPPPAPAGAHGSPAGTAYAALTEVAGRGGALLTYPERVAAAVARWDGGHPPMGGSWLADALSGLPAAEGRPRGWPCWRRWRRTGSPRGTWRRGRTPTRAWSGCWPSAR